MDLLNSMAEGAGAAIANKVMSRKKRGNVFTRLFRLVKMLLDDPEKMELRVTVDQGDIVARVQPDKEQNEGFVLRVSTFGE